MSTTAAGSVSRAAGRVALITALARVVGFLRWLVFAATVGAAGVGSVYQSVNTVPNVVYEVAAGGVLAAVVVPLVARELGRGSASAAAADAVGSALLTRALVVLAPLTLLLVLTAPWVSRALLGDLGRPAVDLGSRLLLLFAPQVLLYGIGVVVTGVLQAHERFAAAALAPLLSSLVVIVTYLAYAAIEPGGAGPTTVSTAGWLVLGGGTTLGVVALSLPLLAVAERAGIRLRPRWSLPPEVARRARDLALAGLVALVAQQLAVLVALKVANRSGGDGAVVVHQYVQALYLLPYAVLAVPVATAAFPAMARASGTAQATADAARTAAGSLRAVLLLMTAAAAALVVAADPVGTVFVALDRGKDGAALAAMPAGLAALAPGLVGFGVAAVATRALYAHGRAVPAGLAMGAGWVVAAVVPLLLLGAGDGPARTLTVLGWGASGGMTLAALLLVLLVRRDWPAEVLSGLLPAALAAVVVLGAAFALRGLLHGGWPASTGGALVAGALAGTGMLAAVLVAAALVDPAVRRRLPRRY